MIALLLLAVSFADAFWARDLGRLTRALAETRGAAEQRLLFDDLLKLATCAPLDDEPDDPLRLLVRVEQARRARVATNRDTIWPQLLDKAFFARAVMNPPLAGLTWPDEDEQWTGETVVVKEPAWRCAEPAPKADELALLAQPTLEKLPAEVRAVLAYERAAVMYRLKGDLAAFEAVDPAALDARLAPAAHLLRFERVHLGANAAYVTLARSWPLADGAGVTMRAAESLFAAKRYADTAALDPGARPPDAPRAAMWDHLQLLRGLSLLATSHLDEGLAALTDVLPRMPRTPKHDAVRAVAIEALSHRPFDAESVRLVAQITGGQSTALAFESMARAALEGDRPAIALAASDRFSATADARLRGRANALRAEIALRRGDRASFEESWDAIGRDEASLLQLSHGAVAHARNDLRRSLDQRLRAALETASKRARPALEADLAALQEKSPRDPVVALGAVQILRVPEAPPPPPFVFDPPEPRSLLAIPTASGALRAWFEEPQPRGTL